MAMLGPYVKTVDAQEPVYIEILDPDSAQVIEVIEDVSLLDEEKPEITVDSIKERLSNV